MTNGEISAIEGMTTDEAIRVLECGGWWDLLDPDGSDADLSPLHEALDVALASLRAQQTGGWISVKDRLPKGGEEVFLLNSYGRAGVGERYKGKWIEYGCEGKAYFRKESYITHWMAVPKPESVLDIGQE